jgi:hypothetical protein
MVRIVVVLSLVLVPPLPAQVPATPSSAEIVNRYIAARGGLEAIRSVRSLVLRGAPRPDGRPGRFMARARPFYFLVGEPSPTRSYAEGFDGASWEYYADPGLVLRTTGAPAAASRHTAYFDDPLVSSLEPGWSIELLGEEAIGGRPAYRIRATYPDSFQNEVFVDAETWLIVAYRKAAPIHAFGESVETETRVSDWRELNGALFPMRFDEVVIATGAPLSDVSGGWATAEVNPELPIDYFSPPSEPRTPLARMLNAVFLARSTPPEALAWYRDFRSNPATAAIDTEGGIEAVAYQCLKNGAVETAVQLLEANLAEHPDSADAHFGLGRAYRAAGREAEAVREFRAALAIDPEHGRAAEALER